jgi:hypothetical protein
MRVVSVVILSLAAAFAETSGVTVQVTVERLQDNHWVAVDPHLVLHGGDEIRFRFRSNHAGYLYVVNHDGQKRNTWLFPLPNTGEQNAIEPGKDYLIPATAGVFQIAEKPGFETTYWILSPEELRGRKTLNPDVINAERTPLLPRCGGGSGRDSLTARGPCTDGHAGAHRSYSAGIANWFDIAGPLQPCDLAVASGAAASHITAAGDFEAPLIYEFRIAHQ